MSNSNEPGTPEAFSVGAVVSDDFGYGFNILGKRSKPLVHFSYAKESDAKEARSTFRLAVSKALNVQPYP